MAFDPPDPTSGTAVTARLHFPPFGCGVDHATVSRDGSAITITAFPVLHECVRQAEGNVTVDLGLLPPGVYAVTVAGGAGFGVQSFGQATLAVRDAVPPFDVRPNAGASGSDVIRIIGGDLHDATSVHFGTAAAEIISNGFSVISVRNPGLAPGIFEVTVEKPGGTLRATAAYAMPDPANGDIPAAFYERVLLPVFWSGAGAFGAQWRTTTTLYNGAEYALTPAYTSVFAPRPGPNGTVVLTAGSSSPAGAVEELPRQAMADIDLGLKIRDTSRDAHDLGTEIPVVRESQLFARPFNLADVPNDPRYRVSLRLYSLEAVPQFSLPQPFVVRIYRGTDSAPAVTQSVTLAPQTSLHDGSFAVVDNLLAGYRQLDGAATLRIEIDPGIHSGIRSAWGFATITNNDTQHATVVSPQ